MLNVSFNDAVLSRSIDVALDAEASERVAVSETAEVVTGLTRKVVAESSASGRGNGLGAPILSEPVIGQLVAAADLQELSKDLVDKNNSVSDTFVKTVIDAAPESGHLSGFAADDAAVDVLLLLTQAWQKAQLADRHLQGSLIEVATGAARSQSEEQVAAGKAALTSAVGASVLNLSMQFVGAKTRIGALNAENQSLKVNTQNGHDARSREQIIGQAIRSAEAVVPSEVETVTLGDGKALHLEADRVQLSARDLGELSGPSVSAGVRSADVATQHALNQKVWGAQHAHADLWRVTGEAVGRMASSCGELAQSTNRAHQTIDQNQQDVSRATASLHDESARQSREVAQKLHDIVSQLVSNTSAVASQVAGNLRI